MLNSLPTPSISDDEYFSIPSSSKNSAWQRTVVMMAPQWLACSKILPRTWIIDLFSTSLVASGKPLPTKVRVFWTRLAVQPQITWPGLTHRHEYSGFLYLDRLLKRQLIVKKPGFCVSFIGKKARLLPFIAGLFVRLWVFPDIVPFA